jgi:mannan endo-1,4-beta-mannosidase
MEEFGMCRDGWGNVDRYSMSAPITNRNKFYEALFNEIIKVGASGWLFWSVAGEGLVDDGKYWIGDPPHEKRGWYSVYNHDKTTWELVKVKGEELQEKLADVKHKSKK